MGGSYRQCIDCGKRALSIATRCPGCGCAFRTPAAQGDDRGVEISRILSSSAVAGVAVVALVLAALEFGGGAGEPLGSIPTLAPADSALGYAEALTLDTTTAAAVPAAAAGELLVAPTWTHVRKARSKRADLEAVLMPGDTVLADSLDRDWYRVALEGEVLGYVHRSTLRGTH